PTPPQRPAPSESHPAHPRGCDAAQGPARLPEEVPWWSWSYSTTNHPQGSSEDSRLWKQGHHRGKEGERRLRKEGGRRLSKEGGRQLSKKGGRQLRQERGRRPSEKEVRRLSQSPTSTPFASSVG